MKKLIFFALFNSFGIAVWAQIMPVQNSDEVLLSMKVKQLSTYYSSNGKEEQLIFQKDLDPSGKLIRKYQLSLWEAISNSQTTTYSYNNSGLLVEEIKTQEYLILFERDRDYLDIFGNLPLHQKITYAYNEENQLLKKLVFTSEDTVFSDEAAPNQAITYEYEDGRLITENSSSLDEKIFNRNFSIKYSYDSAGNMIKKMMKYGEEEDLNRSYIFKYDSLGRLIQNQVLDSAIPHNNIRLKYDYNANDQVTSKYIFNEEENTFELETSYQYDENGNTVSGDRDVNFEYYENGLIKSEYWKDPTSDEEFTLNTRYEFF